MITIKLKTILIIAGVVFIAALGGGYYYYQNNQEERLSDPDTKADEQIVAEDREERVGKDDDMDEQDLLEVIMEDDGALVGELEDVSGGDAIGTAYLLRKDGKLYHYVEAGLPDPKEGFVYEGWLVTKIPSLKFFSTGVMSLEDDVYTLSFTSEKEQLGYNEVVITLEGTIDGIPEEHVLEGLVE